jgi:hypothetical protein
MKLLDIDSKNSNLQISAILDFRSINQVDVVKINKKNWEKNRIFWENSDILTIKSVFDYTIIFFQVFSPRSRHLLCFAGSSEFLYLLPLDTAVWKDTLKESPNCEGSAIDNKSLFCFLRVRLTTHWEHAFWGKPILCMVEYAEVPPTIILQFAPSSGGFGTDFQLFVNFSLEFVSVYLF